ncbi:MAG: hypothetical protein F6K25_26035 [Okeania sp. SIO2G4]|uniref:hypothetical protein n=1 Tax=unclassified Okeania TaxID=2634635 RepID=UPI0013BA049C|nr:MULTISPECIES: hypothetical protein [unclassified Okeania]NEP06325.1 hypothetical protein [Okeania sp. SIO4D6]NEP75164.1 hypothetical protein [Okeania sp. SIO2G5]NEP96138.1 hypothetical protein [Okeania sp. SIO2F5]NEQ93922.1 hypothetical protein [Okeania sp. SIO2G4]
MTMFNLFSSSKSIFSRCSWLTVSSLSLVSFGSIAVSPAQALINRSFENGLNGWDTAGDVSIQRTFQGFAPTDGSSQALLTTATTFRFDDILGNLDAYNFSGNSAVDARSDPALLQSFLGLSNDALNFTGAFNFPHDSKEGSAIKQSISSTTDFEISFDWSFLTNDGAPLFPGDPRDTAFVTLYNVTSPEESRGIEVLAQSLPITNGFMGFPAPGTLDGTNFFQSSGVSRFNSGTLAAGDYILGIGVYDVDGTDKTSALLVDNVTVESSDDPQPVPEPLSTLGLLAVGACIACDKKRQQNTQTSKQ